MDFFKKASASLQEGNASEMFQEAQSFMGDQQKTTESTPVPAASGAAPGAAAPTTGADGSEGGYGEVFSSAQTLYQGIQDKLSGKSEVDNQQLAGAANDVLKAAESSGLLKDSQYTDYFTKAEGYLSSYSTQGAATEQEPATMTPTTAPTKTPTTAQPMAPTTEPSSAPQDQQDQDQYQD